MTDYEKKLWTELLGADMNMRYFETIASRYALRDLLAKIFLAVMSSSTVAGWYFWQDAATHPFLSGLWKFCSAIAALASIILPFLNYAKGVEWAMSIKNGFSESMREYDILWIERSSLSEAKLLSEIKRISAKEASLAHIESHFPRKNDRLLEECQLAVNRSRGL